MEANDRVNCIPERGHNWMIKHSILFFFVIRCTTTMPRVLVATSARAGFGTIPMFDVSSAQLLYMRLARATRNKVNFC